MNKGHYRKFIMIALTALCFHIISSAQTFTLNLNNASVKSAMESFKRNYGYTFEYVLGDVNTEKVITASVPNVTLDVAIWYILQGQPDLVWEINNKTIVVRKSDTSEKPTPVKKDFTLTGRIIDAQSREVLPGTSILVTNTLTGTTTDNEGRFTLKNVPADTCVVKISYIGYESQLIRLVASAENSPLTVRLEPESAYLDEIVVTARKEEKVLQQFTGEHIIKMTPEALKFLPYLGEKDILRSFQLMPGVSAANESNSGMYVRGGTPDQNLILYDGFTVYYVEHLHGFYSAFNTNAIKDVQLYKGGYESKYGGRLSSVTEITSKEGNRNKFTAGGEVSLLSANLYTEIPIGQKFTSLFAFRRSYQGYMWKKISELNNNTNSDNIVSPITRPDGGDGWGGGGFSQPETQTPPAYFYDFNGKLTFNPSINDKISFSIFNGHDQIDNSPQFSFTGSGRGGGMMPGGGGWQGGGRFPDGTIPDGIMTGRPDMEMDNADYEKYGNLGLSLRWDRTLNNKVSTSLLAGYSNFYATRDQSRLMNIRRPVVGEETATETIRTGTFEDNNLYDFSLKNDWSYAVNNLHSFGFGAFATKYDIHYAYTQNEETLMDKRNDALLGGLYVQDKMALINNRLSITPGARVNWFSATQKPYFEPRLALNYKITDKITANAATGVFYQFANRISREDMMAGKTDFWILSDGTDIPVSHSNHFNLGVNYDLPDYIFSVEGYYKRNYEISEYTLLYERNRMLMGRPGGGVMPNGGGRNPNTTIVSENFFTGDGYSTGLELLAQKKAGTFRGWATYTIAQVKNRFPEQSPNYYFANHDIKHEAKIIAIYMLGHFDLSATWIYATGRPYTAPLGIYQIDLLGGNTESFFAISDKNSFRLPDYHRLDLGINYRFNLFDSKGRPNAISFSLFNAYNRSNVNAKKFQIVDGYILESNVNYLSIMPNVSLSLKF